MNERTHVFISSHFDSPLKEWREEIFAWAAQNGHNVWNPNTNPEINSLWADFKTQPVERQRAINARTEDICLEAVRRATLLIAILDMGYGRSHELDVADISVTEMEIVQATLARVPVLIFVSGRAESGSRLASLVHILKAAIPAQVQEFPEASGPVAMIKRAIEPGFSFRRQQSALHHARLITEFCRVRHPLSPGPALDTETGFLEHDWVRHHEDFTIHREVIDELLDKAKQNDNYNTRLLYLWRAVRHLAAHPFSRKDNVDWLPRWNTALGEWSAAAAWCGLHGHMLIGRRASVVSLLHVRKALAEASGNRKCEEDFLLMHGGLASEYFSIAKLVNSDSVRDRVLDSAEACIDRALTAFAPGTENVPVSNQLAILGSVQLLAGRQREATETLRRVLSIRIAVGAPVGQVAEAKAELGFALLSSGNHHEAGSMLEDAVFNLEKAMNAGFAIRAKRKLALYYLQTANLKRAYLQFLQVEALIRLHSAAGQSSIVEKVLSVLRERLELPIRRLRAIKADGGYEYVDESEKEAEAQ